MINKEFVARLNRTFDNESMADVAKRLDLPHATVRNYYQGRLPSPEVLIRIADVTNISLNWLLTGKGETYGGQMPAVSLGRFLEQRIELMIEERISARHVVDRGQTNLAAFNIETAIAEFGQPDKIMNAWFNYEGREYPSDYGVVFFKGWESFSDDEKVAAVTDAKRVLDRSLSRLNQV